MFNEISINCITIYRLINNKIKQQTINVNLFSLNDIKYILLYDKTIKGILIK